MAISFVGAEAASGNTLPIPAHQAGDLIVAFAYRDGNNAPPTQPSGWSDLGNAGANTNSARIAYKIAAGSSETFGTWTNATGVAVLVYRGAGGIGALAAGGASSNSISYPALTMQRTDGTSWVAGFAGHRTATNMGTNTPSGMTQRDVITTEVQANDTNAAVSSWSAQTQSVNQNSGWRSYTIEILQPSVSPYAEVIDGYGQSSSTVNYATARAGAALLVDTRDIVDYVGQLLEVTNYTLREAFLSFDTSAIPDGATITGVSLEIYGQTGTTSSWTLDVYGFDWGPFLETDDWQDGTELAALTPLLASLATGAAGANFSTSGYNAFTESGSNFRSAINKTGITRLLLVSHNQVANVAPTGEERVLFHSANAADANKPKLVVTYTLAATATPAMVAIPASFPQTAKSAAVSKTPAVLASPVAFPQASARAHVSRTPDVIPLPTTFPQASPSAGVTKTPNVAPLVASFPQVDARGHVTRVPDAVALVLAFPQATPDAGSEEADATAAPDALSLIAALPQAGPSAASAARPSSVFLVAAFPQANKSAGSAVVPASLGLTSSFLQALASAGSVRLPGSIAMALSFPQASPFAGVRKTPSPVGMISAFPSALPSAGVRVTPAVMALLLGLSAPTPRAGSVATPSQLGLVFAFSQAGSSAGAEVSPPVLAIVTSFPETFAQGSGVDKTPATLGLVMAFPQAAFLAHASGRPSTLALEMFVRRARGLAVNPRRDAASTATDRSEPSVSGSSRRVAVGAASGRSQAAAGASIRTTSVSPPDNRRNP